MKYYKVTNCFLRSSWIGGYYGVKYQVGKFVRPVMENSKLLCFDSLDAALEYKKQCLCDDSAMIFECEVINPSRFKKRVFGANPDVFKAFWSAKKLKKKLVGSYHLTDVTKGTVFADAIKLVKRVG